MPDLMLNTLQPGVFTLPGVLSPGQCRALIERAEAIGFEPAAVRTASGPKMMTHIRNNDRVVLTDAALADALWQRLRPVLPVLEGAQACGIDALWRFYRYVPGQQFRRHKDGAVLGPQGCRSRLSFLVYLNDDCEGGATVFREALPSATPDAPPPAPLTVTPATGQALLFLHERWHEGTPVWQGRKYVLRSDVFYAD
jgi:predicted 2-oxoglutarate/Fe(II)-dependent dioxygenase YbiX